MSFRLKLTLLAAATSGVVIAAFGGVTWGLVSQTGEDRLDREIKAAAVHFRETGPDLTTARGGVVESFYGAELAQIKFAVHDLEGGTLFESQDWPRALKGRLPVAAGGRCRRMHGAWAWGPGETQGAGPGMGRGPGLGLGMGRGPGMGMGQGQHRHDAAPRAGSNAQPRGCACARRTAFSTVPLDADSWRVGAFPDGPLTLYAAVNLDQFEAQTHRLGAFMGSALALALLAASVGAWWLAHRALRPLTSVTAAAQEITADQLQRRIPSAGADKEFGQLIGVFNGMLERLETSYHQATRFSADVSHELKTPLAIMQGEVEAALVEVPEGGPAQRALASQLESIQRLNGLVHKLLLLSRADAGTLRPRTSEFDLSACVEEFCEDFAALHPELRIERTLAANVVVPADPSLVPQVISNLLSNAVKYNQPEGWVRVSLEADETQAVVRVSNSGPEIDPECRERLFDRFYRADTARGMAAGGGLGLALAREFARAHGGDVVLEASSEPGAHAFRMTLPLKG